MILSSGNLAMVQDGWVDFIPMQLNQFTFEMGTEYATWDLSHPFFNSWSSYAFSNSAPHAATPPDTVERYWVRFSSPDGVDTANEWDALTIRPYAGISTVQNVKSQLQLPDAFGHDREPTITTVERYIRGAEDGIYHITGHYYRPEFIEDEMLQFRAYGMTLRHRPILQIYRLEIWNGNDWEIKDPGRNEDWHYDPMTGLIYVSTVFLDIIPPILRRGYSERRNQGAFKRGIRVQYVYGHDAKTDVFSAQVERIVTKQACIDIVADYDFARLLPAGLDRVTLQQKGRPLGEGSCGFPRKIYAKLVLCIRVNVRIIDDKQ